MANLLFVTVVALATARFNASDHHKAFSIPIESERGIHLVICRIFSTPPVAASRQKTLATSFRSNMIASKRPASRDRSGTVLFGPHAFGNLRG
jgi:hypothetical protein